MPLMRIAFVAEISSLIQTEHMQGGGPADLQIANDSENSPLRRHQPSDGRVLYTVSNGGADGSRTHDLLNAIQALSQLSYGPTKESTE